MSVGDGKLFNGTNPCSAVVLTLVKSSARGAVLFC